MSSVYMVTEASVRKTKRGYEVFSLRLNGSISATALVPLRTAERKYHKLFQFYEKQGQTLAGLAGNYVAAYLEQSEYGHQFRDVDSCDVLRDFKRLLDESGGKTFTTRMDIHDFLKNQNYPINHDGSITLKDPYSNLNVIGNYGSTICYPKSLGEDVLNLQNIEAIFNHFFRGKSIHNGNPDISEEYVKTATAIGMRSKMYHKFKSKTVADHLIEILKIGDKLSEDQIRFLRQKHDRQAGNS